MHAAQTYKILRYAKVQTYKKIPRCKQFRHTKSRGRFCHYICVARSYICIHVKKFTVLYPHMMSVKERGLFEGFFFLF